MSQEINHDEKARGVGELLKEAAISIKARRFEEAEDYCVETLGMLDKSGASEHASKAMALEFMGDALAGMERYEDAANFYKRAMDLSEQVFTQENQVYIAIVFKLARTYESLSLLDECEPFFRSADELAKRHLSPDHPLRETIAEAYAHLISRSKKRREKVSEIMDSFRPGKAHTERKPVGTIEIDEESEDGERDEEGGAAGQLSEAHAAPAYKELRNKATVYEHSSESMQWWTNLILLAVVGAILYFGYSQMSRRPAETSVTPKANPAESAEVQSTSTTVEQTQPAPRAPVAPLEADPAQTSPAP